LRAAPSRSWPSTRREDDSPGENPASGVTADHLAYIIYTSGSTGIPKGVVVKHRPAINLIEWVNRTFAVGPRDRVLFVNSLGFDLSVYDIFGLLAAGGSVRVASGEELRDPRRLLEILYTEPITFWNSAPATLSQLVPFGDGVPAGGRSHLRLAFLSGDWIPLTMPDWIRTAFPGTQVVSLGGATEATVWSNFYPVGALDAQWVSVPTASPSRTPGTTCSTPTCNPYPWAWPATSTSAANAWRKATSSGPN
jgi:non-ribosomal peptide synthetase component F